MERLDTTWTRVVLPSGLTVIHVPEQGDERFYLGVTIRAGSRLETKTDAGVSHFLEHMMFRGSRSYPNYLELARAFESLGGHWNAATGHEMTEYWYSGIRQTSRATVPLFADFLQYPLFSDIETERAVILRELDGETNDHGHSTDLDQHIFSLLWPKTSLALPILGTRDTIAGFSEADLSLWRQRWYTPANMVVCAIGGEPEVAADIKAAFADYGAAGSDTGRLTDFPAFKAFRGPKVKWVEHSDNEYEIRVAFLAEGEWSAEAPIVDLIARILSDGFCSRLNRRLREERGLVYDVFADADLMLDAGALQIGASCAAQQLDEFLAETFALLAEFARHGASAEELSRAKFRAVVDMELAFSSPEQVATKLAWNLLCQQNRPLTVDRAALLQVTLDDVAKVASTLITRARCAVVALGPAGDDIEKRLRKAIIKALP